MGQAPPGSACNSDRRGTPFVKAGEFGEQRPIIREWTTKPLKLAKSTDVLVCVVGATCGKLNLGADCAIGRSVAAIRPNPSLLNQGFLYAFLRGWTLRLRFGSQGSAQGVITREMLASIPMPLPPLAEQERIVKLLDEADELRKLRTQADRRTDALIPSLFHEMFGDQLKKTSRLPILPLGEVVDFGSGATPSKENPEFWNGRTPWVSPKDMKVEEITDAEDHVSAAAFEKSNLQLIPKDTVLIVVRGMILAHTVPICLCRVSVAINQDMKALLPKQPIKPEFLRWSLQSQHQHLLNQVSTAGHGTKKLDSDRLRDVTIPVPPLALQKKFAARVSEIRAVQAEQAASRRRLEILFQSMLHRAFQGEL
jgi:type I restriction enzyme S subunit